MRKKIYKAAALLIIMSVMLCGCTKMGEQLGNRAIVKLIYIDKTDTEYSAGICVFNFEPNSDTAQIKEKGEIYIGKGETIAKAINAAEKLQDKNPFYSHNEILLVNKNAADNIDDIITYFSREEFSRPNTAVFLCDLDEDELSEKDMNELVEKIEAVIENKEREFKYPVMVYECDITPERGFCGYLPFIKTEESRASTGKLVFFNNGKVTSVTEKEKSSDILLLAGKAEKYPVFGTDEQYGNYVCDIIDINRKVTVTKENNNPTVNIIISGDVRNLTFENSFVTADKQVKEKIAAQIEKELYIKAVAAVNEVNTATEADIFGIDWWARLNSNGKNENTLPNVVITVNLKIF